VRVLSPAYGQTGSGKCWATGTQLLLADGSAKPVQSIQPGELLMGDDSAPSRVQHSSLSTQEGLLYRVTPHSSSGRSPWSFNAEHILVLRWLDPPTAVRSWKGGWQFSCFEWELGAQSVVQRFYSHSTKAEAEAQRDRFPLHVNRPTRTYTRPGEAGSGDGVHREG
jgi:hypothetical protein